LEKEYYPIKITVTEPAFIELKYETDFYFRGYTMMNPNEIEGQNKNLPYFTDDKNKRTINMKNNNEFYDEWLKKLVESLYSPDQNLRPTAKEALDFLLINEKNPRKGTSIRFNQKQSRQR